MSQGYDKILDNDVLFIRRGARKLVRGEKGEEGDRERQDRKHQNHFGASLEESCLDGLSLAH